MPALVLVPSPLQASRAARRLCDAQGGVLFGPQVTTLDALAAALLAASGERRPVLTPLAERLLAHAAGREAGGQFAALEPSSGLAAALAGALSELRRGEVTAAAARQAAASLTGAAASRLAALVAPLEVLEARLEAVGLLDRTAALRAAAEAVQRGAPLAEARELDLLVVDGFAGFTPAEWDLVAALAARSSRSRFHVPSFPERPDLSGAAEPYLRRVEGLHALTARRVVEVLLTPIEDPARAAGPAALLGAFGGGRWPAAGGNLAEQVLVLRGEGEEGEARLAARTAARLVDGGIDPGELLVFHPSPRAASERLGAAFAAEGVPFAAGRGRPLADALPVRTVLEAVAAAAAGLDRRAAERLTGSAYLSPAGLAGGLGRLLDRSGALDGRGTPEAALRRRAAALDPSTGARVAAERAALLRGADGLAGLAAGLRRLGGAATPNAHAARLGGWLDGSGLRRRAGRAEAAVAARDLAALQGLEKAAEELARALTLAGRGSEQVRAAEWADLLALAVDGPSLPATGEPAAGAAELWALDDSPGRTGRAALVLGAVRGAFPAAPPAEPLLREPERQAVNEVLRRGALATAGTRRADALHRAACALGAGREVVGLGWPGDGPAGGGAPAPLAVEALLAVGVALDGPPEPPTLATAHTAAEALAAVARCARRASAAAVPSPEALARPSEEVPRSSQEIDQPSAEVTRSPGEIGRSSAEVTRSPGEIGRSSAEVNRPPGEIGRSSAEVNRPPAEIGRPSAPVARLLALLPGDLAVRAESALARGAIERERRDAVLDGRATPHAGRVTGAALATLRTRLPEEWSPSLLEAHARCPFRLLAAAGLGLDDPESTGLDMDGRDEGSLLHAVLERWVAGRVAHHAWPPDGGAADLAGARAVAEGIFERFEREGRVGDPAVWAARRAAVLARLDRIVAAEAAEAGHLVPALLEFRFGAGSRRPPLLLTAGGQEVRVKGRIDRVDASPDRLLVIDYKNARSGARHRPLLEPESFGVTSFQVPLYLLAAMRELPGRVPAATYQLLRSAERLEPVEGAPDEPVLAAAVLEAVARIRAGDLPIRSRDCEGCPFGAVCRSQGTAERAEGGEAT